MNTSLICLFGLSGSGKTTAAKALASALDITAFHSDIERKKLYGLAPGDSSSDRNMDIYSKEATIRTFQRLYELAEEKLTNNESVLVDAAFLRQEERLRMHQLAQSMKATYLMIECQASEQTLIHRIRQRRAFDNDASEATESLVQQQKSWQEALTGEELDHCIPINTEYSNWRDILLKDIRHCLTRK